MRQEPGWRVEPEDGPPARPDWAERLCAVLSCVRTSRLWSQAVWAAVLLALSAAVAVLPVRPAQRARTAFAWVVREDYDFAGKAEALQAWAKARGGWGAALSAAARTGQARLRAWAAELHLPGIAGPSSGAPAAARPAMPVDGSVLTEYGWSREGRPTTFHEGIDLAAAVGTPVVAALDGKVTRVASSPNLGQLVEIEHGRVFTVYAEVAEVSVHVGDEVLRGQRIAVVGSPVGTERSVPPHLHFEVRAQQGGYATDPASFLGLGGSKL